jgi:hypothetical protein
MEMGVSVDVAELRLDAEGAKGGQGLVAEMTALSRDQHDFHVPEATLPT